MRVPRWTSVQAFQNFKLRGGQQSKQQIIVEVMRGDPNRTWSKHEVIAKAEELGLTPVVKDPMQSFGSRFSELKRKEIITDLDADGILMERNCSIPPREENIVYRLISYLDPSQVEDPGPEKEDILAHSKEEIEAMLKKATQLRATTFGDQRKTDYLSGVQRALSWVLGTHLQHPTQEYDQ